MFNEGLLRTIKVIGAEVSQSLLERCLDTGVVRAPQFTGDLSHSEYTQAWISLAEAHTKISDRGTPDLRIPSPTSFSFPYALFTHQQSGKCLDQHDTNHAQSICLYPTSLSAYSTAVATSFGFDCHVPMIDNVMSAVIYIVLMCHYVPRPRMGISTPLLSLTLRDAMTPVVPISF